MNKIMTAYEALSTFLHDGCTIAVGGFLGDMHPYELTLTIRDVYRDTGHPKDCTLFYAAGQGNGKDTGLNYLAHPGTEGMVSRIIGGHYGQTPMFQELARQNKAAAYNFPQGVLCQMYRDIAARKPGVITHIGLNTFADPRVEGGKLNDAARARGDIVEVIHLAGEEWLFYHTLPINVVIIRASYADTHGNCTFQREAVYAEALEMAQAAKTCGGKVIVQVEDIVEYGSLDTRLVRIPGIYVDAIVKGDPQYHRQTNATPYNPAFSGEVRIPVAGIKPMEMSVRKIIARRSAFEMVPHAVINLGVGMPEGVSAVAAEEGFGLELEMSCEAGTIGGIACGGQDFGAAVNPDCILSQPAQFDYYQGGNLDVAVLGLAQADREGNLNVSKFGPKTPGCGGFVDITQSAKKVVFCGTFTAGGLEVAVEDGTLTILKEGKSVKFIERVEQITYSGVYARKVKQPAVYVTERAVFELTDEGLELIEIAPGVDLEKDILAHMEFKPIMKNIRLMDARIFRPEKMGLRIT